MVLSWPAVTSARLGVAQVGYSLIGTPGGSWASAIWRHASVALDTRQPATDGVRPAISRDDPRPVAPGWIMPDMLVVAALKLSHPVLLIVLMEANNAALHGCSLVAYRLRHQRHAAECTSGGAAKMPRGDCNNPDDGHPCLRLTCWPISATGHPCLTSLEVRQRKPDAPLRPGCPIELYGATQLLG
jgi:hypothetical protein